MASAQLWRLSVSTSVEAEEAVMALLDQLLDSASSAYHPADARLSTVSVFLSRPPDAAHLAALRADLRRLRECDLDVGPGSIRLKRVRRENWAESWKKHFRPLRVGRSLLITPSWCRPRTVSGQKVVVLDPGLSFGTGHHPTTWFCLRQLVAHRPTRQPKSFLDLGTGSGILVIAAAKLGYSPLVAIDHDPDAIRTAARNLQRNRVAPKISLQTGDVSRLPPTKSAPWDVVAANLTSDLLMNHRSRITRRVKPGGTLVLAGILRREFPLLARAYARSGFKVIARSSRGEWTSAALLHNS
jgi:ribosomal protein L11 methyltransferase